MESIATARQHLAAERSSLRNVQIFFITLLLAASLLLFTSYLLSAVLFVLALLFYYFYLRTRIKTYQLHFIAARIQFGMLPKAQQFHYIENGLWTESDIAKWNLLPLRDTSQGLLCRHGFTAVCGTRAVQGAEITFHYEQPAQKGTGRYQFLSGTIICAERTAFSVGDWLLLRKGMIGQPALHDFLEQAGYRRADEAPSSMADRYALYLHGDSPAPDSGVLKSVLELLKSAPSLGSIRVAPQETVIFLSNRFYAQKIGTRPPVTEELLRFNALPELERILLLAEYAQ